MARLFSDIFDSIKIRTELELMDSKKFIFIAFEGVVTEPSYFNKLIKKVNEFTNYSVSICPVKRQKRDGRSHPIHIRDGMVEYYKEKLETFFDKTRDELWIVFDIDQHFSSLKGSSYFDFLETLKTTLPVEIYAAISNPSFELWLLLHFKRVNQLNLLEIKENCKISKKETFIKNALRLCLTERMSNGASIDYSEYIFDALENCNSKLLVQENGSLHDHIGTSMSKLLRIIFG